MKPPPQPRSAGAPDRIYRPNAVAELNNETVPGGTSVNVKPIRSTLRRYRLIIRRRFLL
jgi:hypothetical protein